MLKRLAGALILVILDISKLLYEYDHKEQLLKGRVKFEELGALEV